MSGASLGGGTFVADTSAFARSGRPEVASGWEDAIAEGRIVLCPPVELEMLLSARDHAAFERMERNLATLRRLPLTDTCARAAVAAMRALAATGSAGRHRVPPVDCLIAACAQEAGVGVLHFDRHYDRLAEVMAFESRWILPPGSPG